EQRPWLTGRPEIGLSRRVSRHEIEALAEEREFDGETSCCFVPGMLSDYENAARHLAGSKVAAEDLDALLALAAQPRLNLGVRAYALARLSDFGRDPRVLSFFDGMIRQLASDGQGLHCEARQVRFYYSISGLGSCGRKAIPTLDLAETLFGRKDLQA